MPNQAPDKDQIPDIDEAARTEARKRLISRVVAAALLIGGVGVALLDIMATRAHSQTQSASASAPINRQVATNRPPAAATSVSAASAASASSARATQSAVTPVKPAASAAVGPPVQRAARNPSQLNTQITPAASDRASAASASSTPPKTNTTLKPVLKNVLSPATVDWSQAVALSKRSLANKTLQANPFVARLPKLQLDKTRLPVLLPKTGTTLRAAEATMVSFGSAYSLSLPQKPGINIIFYGHRTLTQADKGGVSSLKRSKVAGVAEDIFLSQTEDGWTASFKRYGVVYTVDVSCDDLEAAECKDDGYIRKAIADMGEVSLGVEALKEAALAGVKP